MVATDKVFAGSVPEIYDRFLVPLIFEPYARDLADRIAAAAPQQVLETAAGTGVLTRAMTSRLADNVRIVATDLNQPMLNHACGKTSPFSSPGGRGFPTWPARLPTSHGLVYQAGPWRCSPCSGDSGFPVKSVEPPGAG